jgi:LysR family transcriptional regulator of gallate degradation
VDIQQLRHFLTVARNGSIGQAAELLNLSQPGLSRSIRALEEALGLALFERQARGVMLTDHGRRLITRAEVIVHEHDRVLAEAHAAGSLRSGDVRLGLHDVVRGIGAVTALGGFLDASPTIGLSIDLAAGPELVEKVARAELDIAYTLFPLEEHGNELKYEKLFSLSCHIYQRTGAARPIAGASALEDLLDHHWVLSGAMNFRRAFEDRLRDLDLPFPPKFLQSSSLALTLELVLGHDLVTILPERVAALPWLAGRLERCDVTPPGGMPSGGLLYRREALRIPAVRAVAECFRRYSATL